ncbi:MFS transporter [Methylobacterium brachythecii]|uniref:MFS transporter n=1 Tax=Methylobacterium brachythecii TaxID=1176177 RepID=A0A7W6F6N4_9HYPH|nr:MFS transporter [Methylobacterium brachythecii]MBB3902510.1 putative MFS family arabinose efflux permease [Methylobacterium brachythecii]GLS42357.1 MFS transporter [Methylobacterium brachythecii]
MTAGTHNPTAAEAEAMSPVAHGQGISRATVWFLAISVGVIFVDITAPQTLIGVIAPDLRIGEGWAGLIGTASLLGYAVGLFFLVPLSDLIENRGLVIGMLSVAVISAIGAALAPAALPFLLLLFTLGAACSAIQVLVPIAAAMAREFERGQVIGDVMSGVMVGVLLSRPIASFVADTLGWRAFYVLSAGSMAVLIPLMRSRLPVRRPEATGSYAAVIASLSMLLGTEPVLRRRSLTAALGMAAFTVFWTAIALRLSQAPFNLNQSHIALFALVGASGAIVAPLAGRAGDHGWTRRLTVAAHVVTILGFALAAFADRLGGPVWWPLALLGLAAVILDVGVITDQTLGRRAVNLLKPEARGRLNALFVGIFFLGGAFGSAAAGYAWAQGGWPLVCAVGAGFGALSLISDFVGDRASRG